VNPSRSSPKQPSISTEWLPACTSVAASHMAWGRCSSYATAYCGLRSRPGTWTTRSCAVLCRHCGAPDPYPESADHAADLVGGSADA
jgi:hypothetical protein